MPDLADLLAAAYDRAARSIYRAMFSKRLSDHVTKVSPEYLASVAERAKARASQTTAAPNSRTMVREPHSPPRSKSIVDDLKRLSPRIELLKAADGHPDPLSVLDIEEYRWAGKQLREWVLFDVPLPGSVLKETETLDRLMRTICPYLPVEADDPKFIARRLMILQHAEALAVAERFPREYVDFRREVAEALRLLREPQVSEDVSTTSSQEPGAGSELQQGSSVSRASDQVAPTSGERGMLELQLCLVSEAIQQSLCLFDDCRDDLLNPPPGIQDRSHLRSRLAKAISRWEIALATWEHTGIECQHFRRAADAGGCAHEQALRQAGRIPVRLDAYFQEAWSEDGSPPPPGRWTLFGLESFSGVVLSLPPIQESEIPTSYPDVLRERLKDELARAAPGLQPRIVTEARELLDQIAAPEDAKLFTLLDIVLDAAFPSSAVTPEQPVGPDAALLSVLGGEMLNDLLTIVRNPSLGTDQKVSALIRMDRRMEGWSSKKFADVIGVSDSAIRQTDAWKALKAKLACDTD